MQLFLTLLGVYLSPLILILSLIIIPACFGVSIGLRKLYMQFLLRLFEFGRQRLALEDKKRNHDDEEEEEEENSYELRRDRGGSGRHIAQGVKYQKSVVNSRNGIGKTQREFELSDGLYFCKKAMEAIIDDDVTKRFSAEELPSWNLLTRTNMNYQYLSMRLTILWVMGFMIRYFILLPIRLAVTVFALSYLITSTTLLGCMPDSNLKQILNKYVSLTVYRILCRCFSAMITYHGRDNRAVGGGICVANHTSPIDVLVLASDNCYAFIGQSHGGLFGVIQRALSRSGTDHIWFERFEIQDRRGVTQRLKEHVEDARKLPMLIFPEGTCINNTSVMMFKKGSFDVGGVIYPAAVKYDSRFGDAFWNSSRFSGMHYLLMMMTSWAVVADVWYLPPMYRQDGEEAAAFANRVKAEIAKKGGLVDLVWDGQLKRARVKSELMREEQLEYSKIIASAKANHKD
ncbi:glycerol-3-phosphate acyltransferase 4-like [Antedon mediterranea]|uniref:glycerol-3-phosphate acyltransferase 4-like n=1 Tax=Antedon mediterranea TaxID=105859 RepID=UPI003AF7A904